MHGGLGTGKSRLASGWGITPDSDAWPMTRDFGSSDCLEQGFRIVAFARDIVQGALQSLSTSSRAGVQSKRQHRPGWHQVSTKTAQQPVDESLNHEERCSADLCSARRFRSCCLITLCVCSKLCVLSCSTCPHIDCKSSCCRPA